MIRILAVFLTLMALSLPAQAERILVFAAASLAGPLDAAAAAFEDETGHDIVISYAGSSALARQIEAGAPADVFLSANQGWMDHLAALGHIRNDTRRDLWSNSLVLVSHGAGEDIALTPELDLPGLLAGGRLAVALTEAVPAGVYAREALASLGQWDAVRDSLAEADNVRAALALVATGAAQWGIVYATDAAAEPQVHLRGTFPEGSHSPITYPGALIAFARPEAQDFLTFLATPPAQEIFAAAGFGAVPTP
ncbi:molybdate ABC transporter substrate-binding protein [Pseudooceanicola onchidii]|uniref:molybdate ABC transporter substrate-binding protein n=1 Tax=Pseudooceanicola onchidii TaxID=2562279 RepID=UPI0010AA7DEB|nr:molybdate ABC transporter substrate-binding protein [Pseudooceanicola onchidii]